MDIIADVLRTVRLKGSLFFRSNLGEVWGSHYNAQEWPVFHCVLGGQAWMCLDSDNEFQLFNPGDVCVLPAGSSHFIGPQPHRDYPERDICLTKGCGSKDITNNDATARLLCGVFMCDGSFDHPIFTSLPKFMHVESAVSDNGTEWMHHAALAIDHTLEENNPGASVVVDRLYEVLFVQLIQRYFAMHQQNSGFLNALTNKHINRVLNAIHSNPEKNWTLDRMAELTHQSRTAFNSHFRDSVGMPPMNYVTNWRMKLAHSMLRETGLPMAHIAEHIGYSNPSSFNKAFKRHFGHSPSDARHAVLTTYS